MASEIPRWKARPKQYQEEQTNNDGSIVSDTIEDDSSQSAEYFSNKMLAPLGFTKFSPNQRGYTHINAISNIEVSEVDDPNKIGAVDLAASRTKMTDSDYDYSFGIWLTWKDVWVTVPNPRGGSKILVQGLTGYAQPGKMVAIMGPSGSGKSTLLDVLAGRWGGATKQAGDILLNGRREALSYGTSAYVTQDDILMETLTVGEAVFYSAQLQLPDSMSTTEKKERAKITIKQMGLDDAVNIRIGGWRMKGLSAGQKRRVSIGIEILTRPMLLFLDEPTSGLDSAAAYHVMKRIATLARDDGRTVIASIHQPSGEVFELFDSLYLLAGGRTLYFGEASQTSEFFAVNGFPCPFLRNPCDHYLRTINSDFERDIEEGDFQGNITTSQVINKLVMSYHSSSIAKTSLKKINEISKREGAGLERKGSQASFMMQTYVLIKRSFVNMYRDLGYYWLRVAIYITLCLCVGTIYFNVGQDYGAIQARGSMLMFVAAFLTFMAIGGFPSFVEDMKVFRRERLNGHYGVMAFMIANTVSSIPYLMLIAVFPGAIAYFLVNLHGGFEHFMFFVLVLFSCMMLVESLMMMVASIVPNFLLGIITGAGIQGVMMLNGGFFRLPNDLPKPFWRYPMYYISFHKYANQGFYKNDFSGLNFTNNQEGASPLRGEDILRDIWQVEIGYSKWMDLFILLGMVIVYRALFFAIIKFKEKMRPLPRAKPPNQISSPTLELTT